MKSICLVVPYFGKLPNNFQIWLNSCKYNPTINWIVFTDDKTNFEYPPNVKVTYTTIDEIRKRTQLLYNFQIVLNTPYKLCDYKVAYGEIFRKELNMYDFWGYCDVDLIFGDIRYFITENILNTYDKILSRGHFTLYRNSLENNSIYRSSINNKFIYKDVFTSNQNYSFDEWGHDGINNIYLSQGINIYDEIIFSDIYIGKKGFYPYQLLKNGKKYNSIFLWEEGELYQYYEKDGALIVDKVMYLHLQKRSMEIDLIDSYNRLLIYPDKYLGYLDEINIQTLRRFRNNSIVNIDFLKVRIRNLLKKIESRLMP